MERLEKFQIIFNNPTATYCAGDTVYGYGWVVVRDPVFVESKLCFVFSISKFKPENSGILGYFPMS